MRDDQRGNADALLQLAQLDLHGLTQVLIERAERLVEQQNLGAGHDRPRERNTLLLSAGQLRRKAFRQAVDAYEAQRALDPLGDLGARTAPHLEAERDVVAYAHMRKQRVVLEQHRGFAPFGRFTQDRPAVDLDIAGIRRDEAGD